MVVLLLSILLVLVAAMLRLAPHLIAPNGLGVDHWFWKAYIEKYRATREFPPVLPQFLLDEQQWYPPLFPLLLARLPPAAFDRYSHVIAIGIDLLRMVLVMIAAYLLTGRSNSMLAAGAVYAFTPILVSYNIQLNPRGLGALFLDVVLLLLLWIIWHEGSVWLWVAVALLSGLILLTHKMTTQLFWFCSLAASVVTGDWWLLALVPLSIASALILSRGFYWNVLKAHWDIVSFWHRHWRWLTAHPVLESPIYGQSGYETPTKYFRSGIKGLFRRLQFLFGFNPWAWTVLLSAYWVYGPDTNLTNEDLWVIRWLTVTVIFVLITTFVPWLRCLGNGYLYVYNASFPAALLVGMIWGGIKHDMVVNVILALTLIACIAGICFYLWTLLDSKTLKVDTDMDKALQHLKDSDDGVVMCLPQHWHDVVSYKTGKSVLFGGHGYGFRRLEPLFPVFRRPVGDLIKEHNVRYLLTYRGYLPEEFLNALCFESCVEFGAYQLYRLGSRG
jgi:hypothetical protein